MFRAFCVFSLVLAMSPIVLAPQASAQQRGHDACVRDVSRFCRSHMNEDDQTVLACLQQHRSRLSKACDKVLTENGQ